ncbi:MAG: hypothetical protein C4337_09620 [Armatimonadota bacterium]
MGGCLHRRRRPEAPAFRRGEEGRPPSFHGTHGAICDIIGSGLQRYRRSRVPQSVGVRHAVPILSAPSARSRKPTKRPKSTLRLLKKRRWKERRFARDVNHVISKRLVAKEDLKGIRERILVRKAQRRVPHSWGFHQLHSFIEYKAWLAGVPVVCVDPRNTSRTCPVCGHMSQANRPTQAEFRCVGCGFAGPADAISTISVRSSCGRTRQANRPICKPPTF